MSLSRQEELVYDIHRASGYHNMRAAFFRRLHQKAMIAIVVAIVSPLLNLAGPLAEMINFVLEYPSFVQFEVSPQAVAMVIGFVGVFSAIADVVFQFGSRFAEHRAAELQYEHLKKRCKKKLTEEDLNNLETSYLWVDSSFEDRHVIVNRVSHNKLAAHMGLESVKVPWWQYLLMNLFPFSGSQPG